MSRLWEKGEPVDDLVLRFTVGDDPVLDARLVPYDVRASVAHATMLHEQGHLTSQDHAAICSGLEALADEHAAGAWHIELADEDVHTALERRLVARIGEAGERVHLGRSRNDQVLAALRLYLLDAVQELADLGSAVAAALRALGDAHADVPLPGYTHLQRAMPSSVTAWAAGFAAELEDDVVSLRATERRISKNPLGSAAGYGTPEWLGIDRERTRELLGFEAVHEPATAVQLSRGKAESAVLFELSLLLRDCARLSADLCLFATSEFGFVTLPDRMTTGSSIMPQKRNPDVFELIRGRVHDLHAQLGHVMALPAGLPSGYHRELQHLKRPVFAGVDAARDVLSVLAHALPEVRFRPERTRAAMDPGLRAAEAAYRLVVDEGIPFREAYRRVAGTSVS